MRVLFILFGIVAFATPAIGDRLSADWSVTDGMLVPVTGTCIHPPGSTGLPSDIGVTRADCCRSNPDALFYEPAYPDYLWSCRDRVWTDDLGFELDDQDFDYGPVSANAAAPPAPRPLVTQVGIGPHPELIQGLLPEEPLEVPLPQPGTALPPGGAR